MNNTINIGPALSTSRDWDRERRQRMVQLLQQGGGQRTGHWSDGLAQAGKTLMGAYQLKQQDEKMQAKKEADQKALGALLKGMQSQPTGHPGMGEMSPGGYEGGMAALANHADADITQTLLPQLLMGKISREQFEADRDAKLNAPTPAQRDYQFAVENGFKGTFVDWKSMGGGQETFGNQPIWAADENGNPVLVQVSNRGNTKPVELPDGLTPQRGGTKTVDLGDKIGVLDANGMLIGYQAKGTAPKVDIQDDRIVSVPGMPGGQSPVPISGQTPIPPGGPQGIPVADMPGTEALPENPPNGGISAVSLPPSPEQQKEKDQAITTQSRKIVGQLDRLKNLRSTVADLKEKADSWFTGGNVGQVLQGYAGSDQYAMNTKAREIQALVGLDELIRAKDQGATFGSLTENEMSLLIAKAGTLDPLLESFPQDVQQVLELYEKGLAGQIQDFGSQYPNAGMPWADNDVFKTLGQGGNPQASASDPLGMRGGSAPDPAAELRTRKNF